jgi:AmmeMemoRadiSam system protein B
VAGFNGKDEGGRMNFMKPKLRALEITPIQHQGQELFYFHDRHGVAEDAAIPHSWGVVLALFDGQSSVEEICEKFECTHGQELLRDDLQNMIAQLDENLFLDSPHFRAHFEKLVNEFEAGSTRPSLLAGASYSNDAAELENIVEEFCEQARQFETQPLPEGAQVRGIVVPHIDFSRGGVTEALAYLQLLEDEFDTFIVLGIAHSGVRYPFCAIDKDFETPVGLANCDHELMSDLRARLGDQIFAEQYAHKNEHSIEFVAVFLQAIQQLSSAKIVPIICGGFFEELQNGSSPGSTPAIAEFIAALREVVRQHEANGKRVGLIASVDLAHVGSRFGDDEKLTPQRLIEIGEEDLDFLETIASGDAEKMHAALAKDNNARNVDAHPAVYTFLAAFPELRAQLLDYRQAFDQNANSVVSFAAMTLYS